MAWWAKALDIISAPLSQPSTFFTKGPVAAAKKVKQTRQAISRGDTGKASGVIGTTLASTAIAATGILAVAGAGAGGVLGGISRTFVTKTIPKATFSVAKSVVPKSVIGKVGAGSATILGAGVLTSSRKARGSIKDAPGGVFLLGKDIGKSIEGDKPLNTGDLARGFKTAGLVGLAGVGLAVVAPKIIGAVKGDGKKESEPFAIVGPVPEESTEKAKETPIKTETPAVISTTPIPDKTTIVTPTRAPTRRRTTKKPIIPMKQSVKVFVNTGRYLNQRNYVSRC